MKTIKTIAVISVLTIGMTTSVFASWWNPLTWNIFKKKTTQIHSVVQTTETKNVTKSSNVTSVKKYEDKVLGFQFSYPSYLIVSTSSTKFHTYSDKNTFLDIKDSSNKNYGRIIANTEVEGEMWPAEFAPKRTLSTTTISNIVAKKTLIQEQDGSVRIEISLINDKDEYNFIFPYTSPEERVVTNSVIQSFSFIGENSQAELKSHNNEVVILFPGEGTTLLSDKKTIVQWDDSGKFLSPLYKDFDVSLLLYVQERGKEGVNVASIGDGNDATSLSAVWDIPGNIKHGQIKSGGIYKIVAQFHALPKGPARMCAIQKNNDCYMSDADLVISKRASELKGESGWFTIKDREPPSLKTYTNPSYGFTIQYPSDMFGITQPEKRPFYDGVTNGKRLFLIGSNSDGVLVAASTDATDVANCLAKPISTFEKMYTEKDITTVSINGVSFLRVSIGDAGLGSFTNIQMYKTLHNGTCFAVSGRNSGASPSHFSGQVAKQVALDNQEQATKMDTIVHSFKFMVP
jgi:hypothetical protein